MKRYRIVFGLTLLDGLMSFCSGLLTQPAYAQLIIEIDITEAEQRYLETKGEIKVCVDTGRMPFDGRNDKGEHDGLPGDYFKAVAHILDLYMVLHTKKKWDDLMDAAHNRDCDMVSKIKGSEKLKVFWILPSPILISF